MPRARSSDGGESVPDRAASGGAGDVAGRFGVVWPLVPALRLPGQSPGSAGLGDTSGSDYDSESDLPEAAPETFDIHVAPGPGLGEGRDVTVVKGVRREQSLASFLDAVRELLDVPSEEELQLRLRGIPIGPDDVGRSIGELGFSEGVEVKYIWRQVQSFAEPCDGVPAEAVALLQPGTASARAVSDTQQAREAEPRGADAGLVRAVSSTCSSAGGEPQVAPETFDIHVGPGPDLGEGRDVAVVEGLRRGQSLASLLDAVRELLDVPNGEELQLRLGDIPFGPDEVGKSIGGLGFSEGVKVTYIWRPFVVDVVGMDGRVVRVSELQAGMNLASLVNAVEKELGIRGEEALELMLDTRLFRVPDYGHRLAALGIGAGARLTYLRTLRGRKASALNVTARRLCAEAYSLVLHMRDGAENGTLVATIANFVGVPLIATST